MCAAVLMNRSFLRGPAVEDAVIGRLQDVPARPCPFCGRSNVKFSKEHWLPRDWGEYFPRLPVLHSGAYPYDGSPRSRVENLSHFDKQFGGICADCNNGWLRELDVRAKLPALELGLGKRTHVEASEIASFAASLYRAALIGVWGQREMFGLPDLARYSFLREFGRPPEDVAILIGLSREGYLCAGGNYSALGIEGSPGESFRSFAFGGIGYLFVVVLLPPLGVASTVRRVARAVRKASEGTLVPLWPGERRRIVLPERRISRGQADRFSELGVALGIREEPYPRDPLPESVLDRFKTREQIGAQLRPATKFLETRS